MQYLKIRDAICEQIDTGVLLPRQKLPTERKFSELFDTTRVTLREALSLLESEGKIYREDRRGWFIAPPPFIYHLGSGADVETMAGEQSISARFETLLAKQVLADKSTSILLELPPFTEVLSLDTIGKFDGRPVAYIRKLLVADLFPNLLSHVLDEPLSSLLQNRYQTQYQVSHVQIKPTALVGDMASALRATIGQPATLVERLIYDTQGRLIELDYEYWRREAICFKSVASPKPE